MLALLFFMTGCWDQDSLKDARPANASVFDLTPEGMFPPMLDPGQDFVLPYLSKDGEDIVARGIALFHGQRFTGTLNDEQTSKGCFMS
ncbi:hypothetical protein [Paenibacillus sp. NPDC055715]